MANQETLRNYFTRARHDPVFRAKLLDSARYSKSCCGWSALAFAALTCVSAYDGVSSGVRIWSLPAFCAVSFAFSLMLYDKFGDRVAALSSLDEVPGKQAALEPERVPPAGGHPVHRS